MSDTHNHSMQSLGEVLAHFLQGTTYEQHMLGMHLKELWPQVLGPTVSSFTGDMELKSGVLYVHIRSAALRSQLFENRYDVVRKLNEAAASQIVKDIRLLS